MGIGRMRLRGQEALQPLKNSSRPECSSLKLVQLAILAVVVGAGAISFSAFAKDRQPTTRIVSGTVYDESNNAIVGADVELTDVQTGKVLDIYSQQSGDYEYSGLKFDHDYTIKAMYKGGTSEVRKISMFETRWHLVMNLTVSKTAK